MGDHGGSPLQSLQDLTTTCSTMHTAPYCFVFNSRYTSRAKLKSATRDIGTDCLVFETFKLSSMPACSAWSDAMPLSVQVFIIISKALSAISLSSFHFDIISAMESLRCARACAMPLNDTAIIFLI